MQRLKNFEVHHRIIAFTIIILATIVCTRLAVAVYNPDPILFHFELHHFDYGVVLLIITLLLQLFDRRREHLYLLPAGVGLGLILDEYWFIRRAQAYGTTFYSAIILVVAVILGAMFVNAIMKKKNL